MAGVLPEDWDNYSIFAVIVDFANLTPRPVLRSEDSFAINGITEDGRLLFAWFLADRARYYGRGITSPLRRKAAI